MPTRASAIGLPNLPTILTIRAEKKRARPPTVPAMSKAQTEEVRIEAARIGVWQKKAGGRTIVCHNPTEDAVDSLAGRAAVAAEKVATAGNKAFAM